MNESPPPVVAVCASARHDGLADRLSRSLQAMADLRSVRARVDEYETPLAPTLWVRVVGADEVESALRQLAAMRDRQPACSALLVVDGCERRVLEALVTVG